MDLNLLYQQNRVSEGAYKIRAVDSVETTRVDDTQLWQEFQAGNETAYALIYRNHAPLLYGYGLKLVKDKELIKDCIQDLFVEIWNTKHKLSKVKSIKSYLFKSIRRKLIAECVKRRRTTLDSAIFPILKVLTSPSAEFNLIEKQRFNQERLKLKRALDQLTDRQREIIHLKFYVQLSYVEIAEVMSVSTKGAYKLMGRSINFLRQHMTDTILG